MDEEQQKNVRPEATHEDPGTTNLEESVASDLAAEADEAGRPMERLKELVSFLKASAIAEFDLERPNLKLRLKFQGAEPANSGSAGQADLAQLARLMAAQGALQSHVPAVGAPVGLASGPVAAAAPPEPANAAAAANHIVKSPLVGTVYESPAPGAAPFVKVGDVVEVGQVLCIVEAMKLMNEVEADAAGEIVARLTPSGQPVEYGQPLFEIRSA
jgi:acetyl-CoA carboxylase biotin carboxyl carrier protein